MYVKKKKENKREKMMLNDVAVICVSLTVSRSTVNSSQYLRYVTKKKMKKEEEEKNDK